MSKTAVIYWTGTGNTEAMANAIASGIGDADVMPVSEADASAVAQYDKIAFGCPAMGDEVLEESEFEPFFADVEGSLTGQEGRALRLLRLGRRAVDARLAGPCLRRRGAAL